MRRGGRCPPNCPTPFFVLQSCRARDWYGIEIGGQSANSTFYTYWTLGGGAAGARVADGPWPSDTSCTPQGFTHGAC